MSNLQMNIDKFLGINASVTNRKNGELETLTNFRVTDGYAVEKRNGYTALLDTATGVPIKGQWHGSIGGTEYHLFASDGHIYQVNSDGTTTDLGTLTDAPTNFFFFDDAVYIINGAEYKKWTGQGTIVDVGGYVPVIYVATLPAGTNGTALEPLNSLHNQRIQKFNGDNSATVYYLAEQNISSVDEVLVGGALKTVTTHYTVSLANGTVTFTSGNTPPTGVNNVEIKYTNNSKTEYFNGTGSQTAFQLPETNITSVNSVKVSNVEVTRTQNIAVASTTFETFSTTGTEPTTGTMATVTTTGSLPGGIVAGRWYQVVRVGSVGEGIILYYGGSIVDITSYGSGTHSLNFYVTDTTAGTVTFGNAPASGSKNIAVVYTSASTNRGDVTKYTNYKLFGGKNDNRVFLYGSENRAIYSDLADGVPSAEYFPVVNTMDVGSKEYDIMDLSVQYDRMLIHKEKGTFWSQYDYDTTLLMANFPVYPLNDTIGSSYKGTAQLIRNDPFVINGKQVYRFVSSSVRDERNAKYVSDKIQPILDALTFTGVLTFDNEADREYWIIIDDDAYIYNYELEAWYHFDFAHSITSICDAGGSIVLGTSGGQLMKMDTALTDNGTNISATLETGWLDYNQPNRKKYSDYAWIDILPSAESLADVYINVDGDEQQTARITLLQASSPRTVRLKPKAKKFNRIKYRIVNAEQKALILLGLSIPCTVATLSRRGVNR